MRPVHKTWTDKEIIASAKKYNSRSEWQKKEISSYSAAFKRGILNKCCSHMNLLRIQSYTDTNLLLSAKKYNTRKEWFKNEGGAYNSARKKGKIFLEKCCAHMKPKWKK